MTGIVLDIIWYSDGENSQGCGLMKTAFWKGLRPWRGSVFGGHWGDIGKWFYVVELRDNIFFMKKVYYSTVDLAVTSIGNVLWLQTTE